MKSTRKRWHNDTTIQARRISLREKALTLIREASDPNQSKTKPVVGLHLVRDCDLRATLEEKSLSVHQLTKWTAFLNKRGTLVHLLPKEGDLHMRIPLYFSVAGLSDRRIERLLWDIVEGRIA